MFTAEILHVNRQDSGSYVYLMYNTMFTAEILLVNRQDGGYNSSFRSSGRGLVALFAFAFFFHPHLAQLSMITNCPCQSLALHSTVVCLV